MFVAVSDSWPQKSLYGEAAKQHTMTVLPEPSSQLSPRTHRSLCLSSSLLSVMQPSLLPHSCPTNIPLIASCASQNMLCTFCLTECPFFRVFWSDTSSSKHKRSTALCIKDGRVLQGEYDMVKQSIMSSCSPGRNTNQCELMVKSRAWTACFIIKVTQHNKTMTSVQKWCPHIRFFPFVCPFQILES